MTYPNHKKRFGTFVRRVNIWPFFYPKAPSYTWIYVSTPLAVYRSHTFAEKYQMIYISTGNIPSTKNILNRSWMSHKKYPKAICSSMEVIYRSVVKYVNIPVAHKITLNTILNDECFKTKTLPISLFRGNIHCSSFVVILWWIFISAILSHIGWKITSGILMMERKAFLNIIHHHE